MAKLVSIIVPVYNVEEFLPYCLDSLLIQTYKNIEIILINDGSTDESGLICERYSQIDNRIKVFHKKNGGLSDARNYGIKKSNGEYISFVDSDDCVHPDFVFHLYYTLGDSDISVCDFIQFENLEDIKINTTFNNKTYIIEKSTYLSELVNINNVKLIVAWNKLYKRKIWEKYAFVKGVLHEDEYAIHHIINNCERISISNQVLYYYRQRDNSITSNKKNERSFHDKLLAYYDRYSFYESHLMLYEKNIMLNHILYRCAMRTVRYDDQVWKVFGNYKVIFRANKLPFSLRVILLIKVISYPLYQKIIALKYN